MGQSFYEAHHDEYSPILFPTRAGSIISIIHKMDIFHSIKVISFANNFKEIEDKMKDIPSRNLF